MGAGVITMDMIGKIQRMHFRQNKSARGDCPQYGAVAQHGAYLATPAGRCCVAVRGRARGGVRR
ncbi:conserved hypothetical protein [Thiomonas arsenitoxydans]|uniref:Uncharacterized protein n=1 Tax=Thiomonas arsenitoxydans (strain DSM 22701 / CIP 110005 / 3As) TaxID=426114 RepID=D6CRS8_THIA3|nr:hypothetical protein THI_0583 [Thiomonas arsenitoxydans]CQR28743.1 conserved hypothetical protein [Thiomonas arsenitoxydans]